MRTVKFPTAALPAVRRAVHSVNPNLPLAEVRTLQDVLDRSTARTSFILVLLGIAATVALVLGIVGFYGVVSYTVTARTREIGIRMAVGAERVAVERLVVERGLALAAVGIAAGLVTAAALTRVIRGLLFGVEPVDVATYALTALLVAAVAGLASYIPARRAATLDPVRVLRHE